MITSNDTCYRHDFIYFMGTENNLPKAYIHCYQSHGLSNYRLWVSAPLKTNHFSKLVKDDSPKFSYCHNTGMEYLPKFSSPKLRYHYFTKVFPTIILCYMVCKKLADWLITTLQNIIDTSKRQWRKQKDIINQDKLWSRHHETSSEHLKTVGKNFYLI